MSTPHITAMCYQRCQKNINFTLNFNSMSTFESFDGQVIEYVYMKGSKQTLIFLPALGFDWTYWNKSIRYFQSKGYGILAITLRGHTASRTRLKTIKISDHINDLKLLCSRLNIRKPVLIGASLGGVVAAQFKLEEGARGCICINTPFDGVKSIQAYIPVLVFLSQPLILLDRFKRNDSSTTDFSRSSITNNIVMILKAMTKFNSYGMYLNYLCLKNMKPVLPKGCFAVSSRNDEALKAPRKADYFIAGNHNCAISNSEAVNRLLEKIITK